MATPVERRPRSQTLFDDQHSQRLAEFCAPALTLILQLRNAIDFGEPEPLRQRVKDLLGDIERNAQQGGISHEQVRHAKFALVAFLDETILSSDWPYRDHWVAQPLQLELYERFDAGEVFFGRLADLLGEPDRYGEVLEVYYLCMALGFKGQFQLHDQARLEVLKDEAYRALQRLPGFHQNEELAPHAAPQGQLAAEARSRIPLWLVVALAAVIGVVIYGGMLIYSSSVADEVVTQVEQVQNTQRQNR